MGPSQSKDETNFQKSYQAAGVNLQHPYFGKITLLKHKSDGSLMAFSKALQGVKFSQGLKNQFERRRKIRHPNLLEVLGMETQNDKGEACTENEELKVECFYDYPGDQSLNEVRERDEGFLWQVIFQVAQACTVLEKLKSQHGDLRPSSIFIQNQKVKLAECELIPGQLNGYQRCFLNQEKTYLSPEELSELRLKRPRPSVMPPKCDAFSFGMTILELCTSESSQDCYYYDQMTLNLVELESRVSMVRQKYSECMQSFIKMLLRQNPQERPTLVDVANLLGPIGNRVQTNDGWQQDSYFYVAEDGKYTLSLPGERIIEQFQEAIKIQQAAPVKVQEPVHVPVPIPVTVRVAEPVKYLVQAQPLMPQYALLVHPENGQVIGQYNIQANHVHIQQSQYTAVSPQKAMAPPTHYFPVPSTPPSQQIIHHLTPQRIVQPPQYFQANQPINQSPQQAYLPQHYPIYQSPKANQSTLQDSQTDLDRRVQQALMMSKGIIEKHSSAYQP